MSMITAVAHFGLLRVRWISMSPGSRRTRPRPSGSRPSRRARIMALIIDRGMSMWAIESPNSYCFVPGSSTAPSPATGPMCRPLRAAWRSLKISSSRRDWKMRIAFGVSR